MIRVLIVDDQPFVRQGLRMLLATIKDLEVSGEAKDGDEAIHKAAEIQPELVVMDARMPGKDGIITTEILKKLFPDMLIIVISVEGGEELRQRALAAGASAFAEKRSEQTALLREIHRAIEEINSRKTKAQTA